MTQWIVLVPLEASKRSEPQIEVFIEPGNVLDGIQVPAAPLKANDAPISVSWTGEEYNCERLDLETCARPKA